ASAMVWVDTRPPGRSKSSTDSVNVVSLDRATCRRITATSPDRRHQTSARRPAHSWHRTPNVPPIAGPRSWARRLRGQPRRPLRPLRTHGRVAQNHLFEVTRVVDRTHRYPTIRPGVHDRDAGRIEVKTVEKRVG